MTPGFSDESEEVRVTAACWGRREATREERDEGGQSGRIQRPKKIKPSASGRDLPVDFGGQLSGATHILMTMRKCLDVLLVGGGLLDLRRVVVWWVERIDFGIEKKRTTL